MTGAPLQGPAAATRRRRRGHIRQAGRHPRSALVERTLSSDHPPDDGMVGPAWTLYRRRPLLVDLIARRRRPLGPNRHTGGMILCRDRRFIHRHRTPDRQIHARPGLFHGAFLDAAIRVVPDRPPAEAESRAAWLEGAAANAHCGLETHFSGDFW